MTKPAGETGRPAAAAAAAIAATFAPCVCEDYESEMELAGLLLSTVSERALSTIVLTVLPPQAHLWS